MSYSTDLGLYIDGSWRTGEGRDCHNVINPATGETLAALPLATAVDLDEALAATAKGFAHWRTVDVNARAAILRKGAGSRSACHAAFSSVNAAPSPPAASG